MGFRKTFAKTLKIQKLEVNDIDSELDQVARRIEREVASSDINGDYNLKDFCFDGIVRDTSPTLLNLISRLVSKVKYSKAALSISQSIQYGMNKQSNQTSLGNGIKFHHNFGGKVLIEDLSSQNFSDTYEKV